MNRKRDEMCHWACEYISLIEPGESLTVPKSVSHQQLIVTWYEADKLLRPPIPSLKVPEFRSHRKPCTPLLVFGEHECHIAISELYGLVVLLTALGLLSAPSFTRLGR